MRPAVAVIAGLLCACLAVLLPTVLAVSAPSVEQLATNAALDVSTRAKTLPPGRGVCTAGVDLPVGLEAVRFYGAVRGTPGTERPALDLELRRTAGGAPVARVRTELVSDGPTIAPAEVPDDLLDGTVCVRNRSRQAVALASSTDGDPGARRIPVRFDALEFRGRGDAFASGTSVLRRATYMKGRIPSLPLLMFALMAPLFGMSAALCLVAKSRGE